jgi:hypothetical protein
MLFLLWKDGYNELMLSVQRIACQAWNRHDRDKFMDKVNEIK